MNISTMTLRQALDAMGIEATDAEAEAMLDLLRASGYSDTREVPDDHWRAMLDTAIKAANP